MSYTSETVGKAIRHTTCGAYFAFSVPADDFAPLKVLLFFLEDGQQSLGNSTLPKSWYVSCNERGRLTLMRPICDNSSFTFHLTGKFIDGPSAFWFSMKLMPTMLRFSSLRKNLMPWKRHVSPAHRRVQDTHRGNSSERYRFDMHRANCSSGCRECPGSTGAPFSSTRFARIPSVK